MINMLKDLIGLGPALDVKKLKAEGALVVDVRSRGEYAMGHVKGSINIPLDELSRQLSRLPSKEKPIITVCASGMRSASAKRALESHGFTNVHNGGGWMSLQGKL